MALCWCTLTDKYDSVLANVNIMDRPNNGADPGGNWNLLLAAEANVFRLQIEMACDAEQGRGSYR